MMSESEGFFLPCTINPENGGVNNCYQVKKKLALIIPLNGTSDSIFTSHLPSLGIFSADKRADVPL